MPIVARDNDGNLRRVLIHDVRVFPDFEDSLISVRQLWTASRANTIFGDTCHIAVSDDSSGNGCLQLPFVDGAWTYEWHVVGTAGLPESSLPKPKARGLGIHRPTSTSHVAALPSESAAAAMHRRLLAGVERLRRLPSCTADAPPSLSKARNVDNAASITANATRASHSAHRYEPSYPGRLILYTRTSLALFAVCIVGAPDTCSFSSMITPVLKPFISSSANQRLPLASESSSLGSRPSSTTIVANLRW